MSSCRRGAQTRGACSCPTAGQLGCGSTIPTVVPTGRTVSGATTTACCACPPGRGRRSSGSTRVSTVAACSSRATPSTPPSSRDLPGNKLDKHLDYALGRAPLRVTYSSSPDRGLDKLLDLWPTIYETCFRASRQPPEDLRPEGLRPEGLRPELHVYYGFETWRRLAELRHDLAAVVKIGRLEERLRTTPGVHYHGRAGQAEVARSYAQSQLWLYPTDFLEVSCITAMEAQAAGCKVVATRCGVLPETAPHAWFVDGKTSDPGYDARFLETVWAALADDMVACKTPPSWSDVALQWDAWVWEVGK